MVPINAVLKAMGVAFQIFLFQGEQVNSIGHLRKKAQSMLIEHLSYS